MKLIKQENDVKFYELKGRKISDTTLHFKIVDIQDNKVYREHFNGDVKGAKIVGAVREFGNFTWILREDWAGKRIESCES